MTMVNKALKMALYDWRDRTAPLEFRPSVLKTLGSKVFISDQIIARIVECAPAGKITTTAELVKETGWRKKWAEDHGESLIAVIQVYHPTTPLTNSNSTTTEVGLPRKQAPQKCGACGELGHISSNRNCPDKIASGLRALDTARLDPGTSIPDENTPPTHPAPVPNDDPRQTFFPNPYPHPHAAEIPID